MLLDISAKNLSPFRYSLFGQVSYNITPLIKGDLAIMYGPGDNTLFFMPSFSVSLKKNLDLMILGQLFYLNNNDLPINNFQSYFARFKWSF